MALCALAGLGAPDWAVADPEREHGPWRAALKAECELADPLRCLGDAAAYPALVTTMRARLARVGTRSTVRALLPHVLPGAATGALHPTIRLGYGLRFGSKTEVAAALAQMIARHVQVPLASAPVAARLRGVALAQADALPFAFCTQRFASRLVELVGAGAYPQPVAASMDDIASLALEMYRGTRHVFALHMVSAVEASRELAALIGAAPVAHALGPAMLAIHKVLGSPAFEVPLPPPGQLEAQHAIRYAYSCLVEHRRGRTGYAEEIVAFQRAGLLPSYVRPAL